MCVCVCVCVCVSQCPEAVPYVTYCPDSNAKSLAVDACDRMFGNSFSECLDTASTVVYSVVFFHVHPVSIGQRYSQFTPPDATQLDRCSHQMPNFAFTMLSLVI